MKTSIVFHISIGALKRGTLVGMSDCVELITRVEETFGLKIPDAKAEKMVTVSDLHTFLCTHFEECWGQSSVLPCANLSAFHRVRRLMLRNGTHRRSEVVPDTSLEKVLPSHGRHARQTTWQQLGTEIGVVLPPLAPRVGAEVVITSLFMFGVTVTMIGALALSLQISASRVGGSIGQSVSALLLLVAFLYTICGLIECRSALSRRWGSELPATLSNVGHLTQLVATEGYMQLTRSRGAWNEGQLWDVLRHIIADETSLRPEHVRRASRFVEDMGLD